MGLNDSSLVAIIWIGIGLLGQILFGLRLLVQWIASEKERKSVIPLMFWYLSIGGSLILLAYALYRKDPVFILGQAFGMFVYVRNLFLIRREKQENIKEDPEGQHNEKSTPATS